MSRSPPTPEHPITAAIRQAVRAELLAMIDEGLIGGSPPVPRLAFSPEEFGHALGMSAPKIRDLMRRGMPSVRIGAQTRIVAAEAMAWLRVHGDYLE